MFTIKRFSEQFLILLRQNKNRHLLILAIFVGIQFFAFAKYFTSQSNQNVDSFYRTSVFFAVILCVMACQDVFNKLRSTSSGIQYFMLPATTIEKYAAAWVYSLLFSFLALQATFFITQFVGIGVGNLLTGFESGYGFPEWKDISRVFQTVAFTHSIFFFGSILFRKNPIIKTLGAYIGVLFIFTFVIAWYTKHVLFNGQWPSDYNASIQIDGAFGSSINGTPIKQLLEFIGLNIKWFLGTIILLLWSGAYILLHKKQI